MTGQSQGSLRHHKAGDGKMKKWNRALTGILTGVVLTASIVSNGGMTVLAAENTENSQSAVTTIEYGDLREWIKKGNFSYLQSAEAQSLQSAPYEKMHETLKTEYEELMKMADSYKDDGDTDMQALYESNAKSIRRSMAQVQSTINRMNSSGQEKNMEDMADTLTASAQNLMYSYNQMKEKVAAEEKSLEALQADYDAACKKRAAGLIKDTELETKAGELEKKKNSLASMKEQQRQRKEELLTLLGLSGQENVKIGTVPEPDLEAIRAVSVENDLETAISNDPTWASEMLSKVKGTDNRELKKERIREAAENAEINLRAAYEDLQNALAKYEAAQSSFSAAQQEWDTVCKKQSAGMLSKNGYLTGEAGWLSGKAALNTAKLELASAYQTYLWQVQGVGGGMSTMK